MREQQHRTYSTIWDVYSLASDPPADVIFQGGPIRLNVAPGPGTDPTHEQLFTMFVKLPFQTPDPGLNRRVLADIFFALHKAQVLPDTLSAAAEWAQDDIPWSQRFLNLQGHLQSLATDEDVRVLAPED